MTDVREAPAKREREPMPWRAVIIRLAIALACALAVFVLYRVFVVSGGGQRLDSDASAQLLSDRGIGDAFLAGVNPVILVAAFGIAVVIALVRRRPWDIAAGIVIFGAANLTTQFLKHVVFDRPDLGVTYDLANSFPSGHTTAAAAMAAVFVFVTAPKWRPPVLVVAGACAALAGWATLTNGWHRPSDVVAACAVVAMWYFLIRALYLLLPARDPAARRRRV